jgi:hypothetical protein
MSESTVEVLTFAAVLVLFLLAIGPLSWGFFYLLTAVVLLGSAYYQSQQGWNVSLWTWLFGILFAALTAFNVLGTLLKWTLGFLWNTAVPVVVVVVLVWLLYNAIFKDRD